MPSVSREGSGAGSRVLAQDAVMSPGAKVTGGAALTLGGLREGGLSVCMSLLGGR